MNKIFALSAALALSACVSTEADLKRAGGTCEAGGHKSGTATYQACVSDELAKIEENRRYTSAAIGNALQSYGNSMQSSYSQPSYSAPSYTRRSLNCTSNAVGTYTYTNCY